jgi:hypothetical protein
MANAMVRRKLTEREAFRKEEKLLAFARSYLSDGFPNPERTGCPPDDTLRLMAIRPLGSDESVSEHLTCCSPCFNAYMDYLAQEKAKIRRTTLIRRSAAALGIAAVLVIVAYVFLAKHRNAPTIAPGIPPPITTPGRPNQTQTAAIYVPVLIDLSNASPTRGAKQSTARSVPQVIPSGSPVALSLHLPLGSEERLYLITLRSGRNIVWSQLAQARRENGDTLLRVHADFSDLPAGSYNLQVSSGGRRLSAPVLIKSALPESTKQKP